MGDASPRTLEVFSDCVTVMLNDGVLTREERRLISALSRNLDLKEGEPLQVYEKVKIGEKMVGGNKITREKQLDIFYRTGRPIYTMTLETQHIKSCNNPYAYVDKEGFEHLLKKLKNNYLI